MDTYDLEITQGGSFYLNLLLTDEEDDDAIIDLTDYTVSGFLKYKYGDINKLCNLNPVKELPYESGTISLNINPLITETLPVGFGFYDIELYHSGGYTDKIIRGKASIFPEITF